METISYDDFKKVDKGSAIFLMIVLLALVGGGAGYFVYKEQIKEKGEEKVSNEGGVVVPTSTSDIVGALGTKTESDFTYKSDLYGVSIHRLPSVWRVPFETEYPDGLYSTKNLLPPEFTINQEKRDSYENADYYLLWSYVQKKPYENYDAWYEFNCSTTMPGFNVRVEPVEMLLGGVKAVGCRRFIYSQDSTTEYDMVLEHVYVIHPISNGAIWFRGVSGDLSKETADSVFRDFETALVTVNFYQPSSEGIKLLQEAQQEFTQAQKESRQLIQIKYRTSTTISEMQQFQQALEFYHQEHQDYPATLEEIIPKYKSFSPNDTGSQPLSAFHYIRCSDDLYHLGVSLEDNTGENTIRLLDADLDRSLCSKDTLKYADDHKCDSTDAGNFCFDIGPYRMGPFGDQQRLLLESSSIYNSPLRTHFIYDFI